MRFAMTTLIISPVLIPAVGMSYEEDRHPITERPALLCQRPRIIFAGGDGNSISNAVTISGTTSTKVGIQAEHRWIKVHKRYYGQILEQSALSVDGRHFDVIVINVSPSNSAKVYFDITSFFGKHEAGRWRFTSASGEDQEGTVTDWDYPPEEKRPWKSIIGNRNGELVYQVEANAAGSGELAIGPIVNGAFDGQWKHWLLEEVELEIRTQYRAGRKHGIEETWSTNGVKWSEQQWVDGKENGVFKSWSEHGRLWGLMSYTNGMRNGKCYMREHPERGNWTLTEYEMGRVTKEEHPSSPPAVEFETLLHRR